MISFALLCLSTVMLLFYSQAEISWNLWVNFKISFLDLEVSYMLHQHSLSYISYWFVLKKYFIIIKYIIIPSLMFRVYFFLNYYLLYQKCYKTVYVVSVLSCTILSPIRFNQNFPPKILHRYCQWSLCCQIKHQSTPSLL